MTPAQTDTPIQRYNLSDTGPYPNTEGDWVHYEAHLSELSQAAKVAGEAITAMMNSAHPNPVDHPAMSKAFDLGRDALSELQRIAKP